MFAAPLQSGYERRIADIDQLLLTTVDQWVRALAFLAAHDLIRRCFVRRSRRRTRVPPLAGPSTGSGGKPVPIPDRGRELFGIVR